VADQNGADKKKGSPTRAESRGGVLGQNQSTDTENPREKKMLGQYTNQPDQERKKREGGHRFHGSDPGGVKSLKRKKAVREPTRWRLKNQGPLTRDKMKGKESCQGEISDQNYLLRGNKSSNREPA